MKIHSATAKNSKLIKLHALWPFMGFIFSLTLWFKDKPLFLLILAAFFLFLFVYTLFFSRYELFIDTESKKVMKRIRWLFINSKTEFNLTDYKAIYIALGDSVAKSNLSLINNKSIQLYDVILVHKHAANNTGHGMINIMENFLLMHHIRSPQKAKEIALEFSKILDIDILFEEQVAKIHPNLLCYGKEF